MNYQKGILVNRECEWKVFDLQYYIDAYQVLIQKPEIEDWMSALDNADNKYNIVYWDEKTRDIDIPYHLTLISSTIYTHIYRNYKKFFKSIPEILSLVN